MRKLMTVFFSLVTFNCLAQMEWLQPVQVAASGPDALYYSPQLARHPDGTAAATFVGVTYETSGTMAIKQQSNIYATFSQDAGANWTTPVILSDPEVVNTYPSLAAGTAAGEFHVVWTSGDSLSGFRLHTATVSQVGNAVSSQTILQDYTDNDQGFLLPAMVKSGNNTIISRTAYQQSAWNNGRRGYISVINGSGAYSTVYAGLPTLPNNYVPTVASNSVDADNTTALATFYLNEDPLTEMFNLTDKIMLRRSTDSGSTWQSLPSVFTYDAHAVKSVVKTDGAGTWMLAYADRPKGNNPGPGRVHLVRSTDAGTTWTENKTIVTDHFNWGDRNLALACDGSGRWLTSVAGNVSGGSPFSYTVSADNGESWAAVAPRTEGNTSVAHIHSAFLGNGRWGVAWSDASGIRMSILNWGPSAVDEWSLY